VTPCSDDKPSAFETFIFVTLVLPWAVLVGFVLRPLAHRGWAPARRLLSWAGEGW
jgi:hypothetical protein